MVATGYDPDNGHHRSMLLSLLMTACDLSDQAKDWENSKETAVGDVIK
jgi:cGMP-dependent 3',5'-cyclic phosphodiesterase